jgi:hypothetical protein
MLIVDADLVVVERDLGAGLLACPGCDGVLGPWGWARPRVLRCRAAEEVVMRPRRAKCRACRVTHVLLGERALIRRRDEVAVIGAALLEMVARGRGHRRVAVELGLPVETVRGWRRAFVVGAEAVRAHFTRWAHALDPELGRVTPAGSAGADALEAIAIAARSWVLRFGSTGVWPLTSLLSGGALLCNTSSPFPRVR